MGTTLVDMKREPVEIEEKSMPDTPSRDIYPYGLCLCLDEESLEKLGLEGAMPELGTTIGFMALAKVTSVSKSDSEYGSSARVEIQITHIGMDEPEPEAPSFDFRKLYKGA